MKFAIFLVFLIFAALVAASDALWLLSHMKLSALSATASHQPHGGSPSSNKVLCSIFPGLSARQRRICERHKSVIVPALRGADLGLTECRHQFKAQRWNCSRLSPHFRTVGSREAAFVYAITSAGVVHAVARACAMGDSVTDCSCGKSRIGVGRDAKGEFLWGGCSDNLRFATRFARKFIDSEDRKNRDPVALMNLHNYRAGRRAVRRTVSHECKCHGVSGSCTTRTCWKAVGNFRSVGDKVFKKYRKAMRVRIQQQGRALMPIEEHHAHKAYDSVSRRAKQVRPPSISQIKKADLVYFEPSPDYCIEDVSRGSVGTAGRECNRTSTGPDNCNIMCCGRGYDTKTERITFKCDCRFNWCCEVKCRTCTKTVEVYTCKSNQAAGPPFQHEAFRAHYRDFRPRFDINF